MTKSQRMAEAYNLISGELFYLPNKKWKGLPVYRSSFSYVKDNNIKTQIINFNLALDYQLSLYELHKPLGNLEEMSFICACHLIGSVSEALLRDLYFFKLKNNSDKKFVSSLIQSSKINRIMFRELLDVYKSYLDTKDITYLENVVKLRNTVHINTNSNTAKVIQESGHTIQVKIKDFFDDSYINKKIFDFKKLETDFNNFIDRFSKYY